LTQNEDIVWITDELNGSLFASWNEFFSSVRELVPLIRRYVIESSQRRGEFFPQDVVDEDSYESVEKEA